MHGKTLFKCLSHILFALLVSILLVFDEIFEIIVIINFRIIAKEIDIKD